MGVKRHGRLADHISARPIFSTSFPCAKNYQFAVSTVASRCVLQTVVKGELAASTPRGLVAICNHKRGLNLFLGILLGVLVLPLLSSLKAGRFQRGGFFLVAPSISRTPDSMGPTNIGDL